MKVRWSLALLLAAACGLLLQANFAAGEKKAKEPEKKKEPAPDIVVNGEIINADLKDKITQGRCKTYTFKMEKGKSYHIEVTSDAFPAYVRLENLDGNQID